MPQEAALRLTSTPAFLLLLAWAFATGAALGSFLGLVVDRLPRHESIVRPRSRCNGCKRWLTVYDMVPILSWLWLRGRCRHCGVAIGARALWTECAMAGLSCALIARFGLSYSLLLWWPLCFALFAIALLDIDWFWVPDALSLPAMAWAALTSPLPGNIGLKMSLWGLLPAACLWAFTYGYERLSRKEAMGFGDIKLLAVMGLALGPVYTVFALTLAAIVGALVGTLALALGGHRQAADAAAMPLALADDEWTPPINAVPFGPFLVLSTFATVLAPELVVSTMLWLPERLSSLLA